MVQQSFLESMLDYLRCKRFPILEQLITHCSDCTLDIIQSSNMTVNYSVSNFSATYESLLF